LAEPSPPPLHVTLQETDDESGDRRRLVELALVPLR
jgi:hypothetical protein